MELPSRYLSAMRQLLGEADYEKWLNSFKQKPYFGLRFNPLKVNEKQQKTVFEAVAQTDRMEPVPWSGGTGYYYDGTLSPARHPYYYAGLYYLQEPSAMAPGALLPIEEGDRALDLCAAPGGKSTQLGGRLNRTGMLLSNDISISRARALLKNIELAGITGTLVTAEEPERLAGAFPEFFDKILVDAPCSGEGMFRKEPSMIADWNEKGPDYYAPIQREILKHAAAMLRPGGKLLYSTCTYSVKEDEENVLWLLKEYPDLTPVMLPAENGPVHGSDKASLRLFPWLLSGEGHFAALFQKKEASGQTKNNDISINKTSDRKSDQDEMLRANRRFLAAHPALAEFLALTEEAFESKGWFWQKDGCIYLLPLEKLPNLRYLRTGLFLGEEKKNRFEPAQALAMALDPKQFQQVLSLPADDIRILKYLKGETIFAKAHEMTGGNGFCLVCADGFPLGFAKRNKETLKNKYYPGWRWQA